MLDDITYISENKLSDGLRFAAGQAEQLKHDFGGVM